MATKPKNTTETTTAPTGINISRNGNKFTITWKIGSSDYGAGQQFYYNVNNRRVVDVTNIGTQVTSYPATISLNNIKTIMVGIRGRKKKYTVKGKTHEPAWSAWTKKTYTMAKPDIPNAQYELDSNNANAGTFSFSVPNVSDTNNKAYLKYEWEAIIVNKWNDKNPPTTWTAEASADGILSKGTTSTHATSYSWYKKEDSALFNDPDYSYTRWFRVRSVGSAGPSNWKYVRHVYSLPRQAYGVKATAIPKAGEAGYSVIAEWTAPESEAYPIETDTVSYAVIKPRTVAKEVNGVMVTSMDYPAESPSWTVANTINDTLYDDALAFSIPEILDNDECIFVKIDTKHDSHITQGVPVLAEGAIGHLAAPSVTSITSAIDTHRVTVAATNNSDLSASFIAIYFRSEDSPDTYQTIGIIKKNQSQVTVQCPDWGDKSFSIGVQALLADYSPVSPSSSGVTTYTISNIKMQSDIVWDEGKVPLPPKIEAFALNSTTIRVLWDWTWTEANKAELSWADHADAWESTDGPQTYEVTNLHSGAWNISNVAVGTWYVRVRLLKEVGDSLSYGLYSDIKTVKLSSAPATPSLILSSGVVAEDGDITCYWAYTSTDGTEQMQADICEAFYDSEAKTYTYGNIIDKTSSAQHITLHVGDFGWQKGETHYLAVRVLSMSGEQSQGWSTPMPVKIAEPLTVTISNTSLTETGDVLTLSALPLSFSVGSKGAANDITVIIERAEDFHMNRPDENDIDGYEGEIIVSKQFDGDGDYMIETDDLIGYLDDDAKYRLIAIGKDSLGQAAKSEAIEFIVQWANQAVVPSALCEMDTTHYAAILMPTLPDGYTKRDGDVCDIYRLSADTPELIYENAEFGTKYVDPYPTLGEMGGHRFVFKTANGDYTTSDNRVAWYDTRDDDNDHLDLFSVLIDYNGEQISLPYNVQLSSRWAKDFQQTNYLGGSIQGDWNPAVTRTGSVTTVGITSTEFEDELDGTIESVRRLAMYPGICHVRTPDGSSYSANINVSEDREEKMINKIAKYSLEITAVDSQELDGVTYEVWQGMHQGEDE